LYVSYRQNDAWTPLVNLGEPINSAARDYSPRLSADGRTLYFASERGFPTRARTGRLTYEQFVEGSHSVLNGLGNLYEVSAQPITEKAPR
jgi:tricorn protease-like protein